MASLLILLPSIPILQYMILLILIQIPPFLSSYDYYRGCANLLTCGDITNIGFPFWGDNRPKECGHPLLQLTCLKNISYITIKDVNYQVLEANPDEHTLTITRVDYLQNFCPSKLVNTTLDTELFVYGSDYQNITLFYGCAASSAFRSPTGFLPCVSLDEGVYTQFGSLGPPVFCKQSVVVPVCVFSIDIKDFIKIQGAIKDGFLVRWIAGIEECEKCKKSGGVCGYDMVSKQPTCYYCKDQSCSNYLPDAKAPPPSGISKIIANCIFCTGQFEFMRTKFCARLK